MKAYEKHGTSLYCETGAPSSGLSDGLYLRTLKIYVQYLHCGWSSWLDGLSQSPSEAVPFDLREGHGVRYSLDGQSVALWEEDFRKSLCLLSVP